MDKKIIATYRLQINKDFTLWDAGAVLPYLKSIGITHIYLSPIFESTQGSMHGYDICDFTKISSERGGEEAFAALDGLCLKNDMRLILDIVPNHMGIAGDNPFWLDVLSKGKDSAYWNLFDMRVGEDGKIHLPILEKPLEEAISAGDAKITEHETFGRVLSIGGRILPLGEGAVEDQAYKPVVWTEAFEKISYRRFFDITDLIGVRVEDREIYDLSHKCLLKICRQYTSIAGVRVDHIDGLADPTTYLKLLNGDIDNIWVEKILSGNEKLPEQWPVLGTTGYEFVARLNDLLVNPDGFKILQSYWYEKIEPRWKDFESCVLESKQNVLDSLFPSEHKRLVALSEGIGTEEQADIFWRGMTVALGVYRTYTGENPFSDDDRQQIEQAVQKASSVFGAEFVDAKKVFMPILLNPETEQHKKIVQEWQQLSGPAMAKGLEDCAHYRYTPLVALNEVGCEAKVGKNGLHEYFSWADHNTRHHPYSLLATSTHDTKRSEDVRARLYALADNPGAWIEFFEHAVYLNAQFKKDISVRLATEYLLYQALVGTWPWDSAIDEEYIDRICAYMQKSIKEARVETSWLKPDTTYEKNIENFVKAVLANTQFVEHVQKFVRSIEGPGAVNALTTLTLKILGPGIPDIYQGCDGWDFSLVDPDNRRAVDFTVRAASATDNSKTDFPSDWKACAFKIRYTQKLLEIRKEHLSGAQALRPLTVSGEMAGHVIAYGIGNLVVICPRFPGHLQFEELASNIEAETAIPSGAYRNLLSGEDINIDDGPTAFFATSPTTILRKID